MVAPYDGKCHLTVANRLNRAGRCPILLFLIPFRVKRPVSEADWRRGGIDQLREKLPEILFGTRNTPLSLRVRIACEAIVGLLPVGLGKVQANQRKNVGFLKQHMAPIKIGILIEGI